jgi:hypothetical protein
MSRSVAENVRTFRLLTYQAPKRPIYKNYIKIVWFLIITECELDVKASFGEGKGRQALQGAGSLRGTLTADKIL